jgi:aminopeptidase YwaD
MSGREQMRRIEADLAELCVRIGERPVGSAGNRRATDYVAGRLRAAGLEVETPGFDCLDWAHGETGLWVGAERVRAFPGPYSPPAAFEAPFETAGSVEELAAKDFRGKAAVLHGGLCREQLMPKNFRFYNPEEHQRIIGLLEAKAPLAVVCITGRCPELAGGQSPFPLIEDGDFELPSVYLTEEEGARRPPPAPAASASGTRDRR